MTAFLFVCFLVIFALSLLGVGAAFRYFESKRRRELAGVLDNGNPRNETAQPRVLFERKQVVDAAWKQALRKLRITFHIDRSIKQAGLEWDAPVFLALSAILGLFGLLIGMKVRILGFTSASMLAMAAIFAAAPYAVLRGKRRRRLREFEESFPEALDFLARSMRAGHAFSISMEMLGQESPEPIASEFRTVFNEHNLGAPLEIALGALGQRVPLLDVKFFVSSVLLQRQTGGNLSEVLTRLAIVIRERFRLKGQVRAASAHGRITATILTTMPVLTIMALMAVAPDYLKSLATDSDGKYLIAACIGLQGIGYYWMHRLINIKV